MSATVDLLGPFIPTMLEIDKTVLFMTRQPPDGAVSLCDINMDMKNSRAVIVILIPLLLAGCSNNSGADVAAPEAITITPAATSTVATTTTMSTYDRWAIEMQRLGRAPQQGGYDFQMSACTTLRAGGSAAAGTVPARGPAEYLHTHWGVGLDETEMDLNNTESEIAYNSLREKAEIIEAVIPILCPDQIQTIADAKDHRFTTTSQTKFGNGKYLVGETFKPGTYIISTQVSDCYWERSDSQGNIIDNNFVSIAPSITVTIAPTDSGFTSQNCGTWELQQ
ncbi:hypothetical protein [Rhodococcus sp. JT-3]|uniref:hypothetical protein n=1 Tax=Rhodococcus sp. JT-3 TaxID=1973213 RepID=UPI001302F512|nr:hypothetical protein [Rhodococcus sp. JT-3]